jgi:gamma-glutamyltranspeptidase/glutathione hydrolase
LVSNILKHRGVVVAPHYLAAQAGADILREGGNAVEAMIAAAASIAVAYPHMNGLGGDNFWLIHSPDRPRPLAIDACGGTASMAKIEFYNDHNLRSIPNRGPLSAITMAGAVSGWQRALQISEQLFDGKIPLRRLLEPAIEQAKNGTLTTKTLANNMSSKRQELEFLPGFASQFMPSGRTPNVGEVFKLPALAGTLNALAKAGLDDFYNGDIANSLSQELEKAGSPLRRDDFSRHRALDVTPLELGVANHRIFNLPPPTQGLASLILLGVFERLKITKAEGFDFSHGIIEATKRAFNIRDEYICDPSHMTVDVGTFLTSKVLDELAASIDMEQAAPWPHASTSGDTVWLGAIDSEGRAVSFIQSVYWEFGSGIVLPQTGITWQNRGTSFSLNPTHHNCLHPHKRPFHTIQPALGLLNDGRVMPYGTMGGEGQPQTQAMIFARYVLFNQGLQQAIDAPRWLLGKTWGNDITNLRIENRFDDDLYSELINAGHDVQIVGDYEEIMGHAGALILHRDGSIEGASDPRSDGAAVAA